MKKHYLDLTINGDRVEMHDFVNAVRTAMPNGETLPLAEAGTLGFVGVGESLTASNPDFRNQWHTTAVNLVAKILMNENRLYNPLAEFEGDLVANGKMIEEMIIDAAETALFNPTRAEVQLFDRRPPELYAVIHQTTRDVNNSLTLQDTWYTEIFSGPDTLNRYVISVTESIASGNEYEKYYTTKEMISNAQAEGKIFTIDLGATATPRQLQKAIISNSRKMSHPNRIYNFGRGTDGVRTQTNRANLRMLITEDALATLNVDFFANAFNLDAVQADIALKPVDYFPDIWQYSADHTVIQADFDNKWLDPRSYTIGDIIPAGAMARVGAAGAALVYDASKILAVVLDKRKLIINPVLPATYSTVSNPLGRYTNIIFNEKCYYSVSPFLNAFTVIGTLVDPDVPTP
jgi:hypothetical protein